MRTNIKLLAMSATVVLAGCQQPGANLGANVYRAGQVNQQQDAHTVKIIAVLPAKIEVSNEQAKATAQLVGGLVGMIGGGVLGNNIARHSSTNVLVGGAAGGAAGALAGSLVPNTTLVDGVSLTYAQDGRIVNCPGGKGL